MTDLRGVARRVAGVGVICVALLAVAGVARADSARATHVVRYWVHDFVGQVDGRNVHAALRGIGRYTSGRIHVASSPDGKAYGRYVQGWVGAGGVTRLRTSSPRQQAGQWMLKQSGQALVGKVAGKPVTLQRTDERLPHPLALSVRGSPGHDDCYIQAILVKHKGRVVQTLPAQSDIECRRGVPEFIDLDFDGHPDLMLPILAGAGPNVICAEWLYDPSSRRFVDAPQSLEEISSPQVDAEARVIFSEWRSGCCHHGVDVYRWRDGKLVPVVQAESHFLVVMHDGGMWSCYLIPGYVGHGHVATKRRVERRGDGTLHLNFTDFGPRTACNEGLPSRALRVQLNVWHHDQTAKGWVVARTDKARQVRVGTGKDARECPQIPVFDHGKVRWKTLTAASRCQVPDPSGKS